MINASSCVVSSARRTEARRQTMPTPHLSLVHPTSPSIHLQLPPPSPVPPSPNPAEQNTRRKYNGVTHLRKNFNTSTHRTGLPRSSGLGTPHSNCDIESSSHLLRSTSAGAPGAGFLFRPVASFWISSGRADAGKVLTGGGIFATFAPSPCARVRCRGVVRLKRLGGLFEGLRG